MELKPKIFFSYAWGDNKESPGESRESIVNELYESLSAEHYNPIRDKNNTKYKDFLTDYIAELGRGKCIVVAISEKYLQSTYCMFELYEIARHSNFDKYLFREKVIPVMVEFIDFNNPAVIDHYLVIWEAKFKEWSDLIAKRAGQVSVEQMQRFDKVKMIYQNFGKLADWLADMNTLNPQLLSKDNFAEIKRAIIATLSLGQTTAPVHQDIQPIQKSSSSKKKARWSAILLFVTTLLILSVLVFGHVSSSVIKLDLVISEVNFRLSEEQVFTNEMRFLTLGAAGLKNVGLSQLEQMVTPPVQPQAYAQLALDSSDVSPGSISLGQIALPQNMLIGIQVSDIPRRYRMTMAGKDMRLPVQLFGPVEIGLRPSPVLKINLDIPKSIDLISGPSRIDLNFSLLADSANLFQEWIPTDSLALFRIDQHFSEHRMLDTVSTILAGTLGMGTASKSQHNIDKGQLIQFKSLQGEIRKLELKGSSIVFSFVGKVKGITTMEGGKLVNLMPTYWEWLRSGHELALLLAVSGYIVVASFCIWYLRKDFI